VFESSPLRRSFVALLAVGCLARCAQPSAEDLVAKARQFSKAGRTGEAIVEYRRALQSAPSHGDWRVELSDLYAADGDTRSALDESVKAADLLPANVGAQLRAGGRLLMAGYFDDARTRAAAALKLDPRNVEGAVLLGNALAGLHDLDAALDAYQEAIAINPSEDEAYTNIAALRLIHGNRAEAEASFKKAIEVGPKSISARMAYAHFLWAAGRPAEAEQVFKEVLAIDPNNASANRALGALYMTTNRSSDAETYFRTVANGTTDVGAKLMLADYYAYVKRFADARRVLTSVDPKSGGSAATLTRLAVLDADEGNRGAALSRMQDVLAKHPHDAAALLTEVRLLRLDGKREQALALARTVAEDTKNVPAAGDAYLLIGSLEGELGHRDLALSAFESAVRLQPDLMPALLALATLQLSAGNYDAAKARATEALTIQPNDPQARTILIRAALGSKDLSTAQSLLAALARDYPGSTTVLTLRADVELEAGRADAARQLYAKAAALAPTDLEATAGLIGIDLGSGHADEAIAKIEARLATGPPSASLLILAARAYAAAGQRAKAEQVLQRAITTEPGSLDAYAFLGQIYLDENHVDAAKAQFHQIVAIDPRSVSAHTMLGMLDEMTGQSADAEAEYSTALKLNAHAMVAANNLAWIFAVDGRNLDQALQLAQAAHEQAPDEPHVNDTLGWVYYRRRQPSAAVKSLEASVARDTTDPATHYHLGMAYVLAGDSAKARVELQRAVDARTAFAGLDEARATLAKLR
jgi:tetratricopeptide (TPR) repeat protein